MRIMERKNLITVMIATTVAAVIILTVTGFAARNKEYKPSNWVLKKYGNAVALYNGENLETVYEGIVVENLPEEDVKILENGIAFPTRTEAEQAIEDYDG